MALKREYKFYVKASPDGRGLGDCPFTHRANIGLKAKGVTDVSLVLIDLSNKPEWYKKLNPAGSVPALQYDDEIITDSYKILEYLDETYPEPPLNPPNNKEAEEATGQIFGAFSAWIKNTDDSKDSELKEAFEAELEKINNYMGRHSWSMLCSDSWSFADCVLAPRLYHIQTVAEDFKGYTRLNEYYNLKQYMDTVFLSEEFVSTCYPREYILKGWAKYRK
ncbi:PREDICTED: glutathione S-transferase DHAR1, mitochondrial-like [Amphimedon queenslandica]|uniref:GST N-terminal domain-containing protein n=1 Tax=Amphimedon queenslandica TaxID=400682 RepID=A0A1X7V0I6_AMPQE|nr:PREDICTED: glutathione S-transferase DHAR1, mitochondrial-like [Amphimedon queenslandica]|eukprot:XP_003386053.1 PREDICTED: glutathione S-transferase DHAR1, mitochondrial-like [Amphimedon queenslandica]